MSKRLAAAVLLLFACRRGPELPLDTLLWRVAEWREEMPGVRRAPGVFMSFRRTHEYVRHMTYVIERPDTSVYFASNSQHVVLLGTWKKEGRETVVTPDIVWRTTPVAGRDPLCDLPLRFTVSSTVAVVGSDGTYSPITRLVAPDYENYVTDAKRKGFVCHPPPEEKSR